MRCQTVREAVSARLDGEDPVVDDHLVDRHLVGCAACRAFSLSADTLRGRLSVRLAEPVPDQTDAILRSAELGGHLPAGPGAVSDRDGVAGASWTRWALLGVVLVQVAVVGPSLIGSSPGHDTRELGAWYLAMCTALLWVVVRPHRALGLLPFAGALAVGMAVMAVVDVAGGRADLLSESQHLTDLLALGLLWRISRAPGDDAPLLAGLTHLRSHAGI